MNREIENLLPHLTKFVHFYVTNSADAEDIVQDVLLKIHLNLHTLQDETKLKSWCLTIARNTIFNHLKKAKSNQFIEIKDDCRPTSQPSLNYNEMLFECVENLVERLETPYKEIVTDVYYKGISQKELAEKQCVSISGIKSRVQRGREKIKNKMLDCCNFEFDSYGNLIDYEIKKPCF